MRLELRGTGVRVSTVHPVLTSTEFSHALLERTGKHERLDNPASRGFVQPPETVANAVVKCLKKPKGEVWTSLSTRLAFALATAFPGAADLALARFASNRDRQS
jgi:short-subunit dehydrogenase